MKPSCIGKVFSQCKKILSSKKKFMKKQFLLLFLIVPLISTAQFTFKGITIDGSVLWSEVFDTTHWITLEETDDILIRENETAFYVAIKSNTYTASNAYLKKDHHVQIMHCSYSLGNATFVKSSDKNKPWTALEEKYYWQFRDPILRDTAKTNPFHIEIRELYNNTITLKAEQAEFYKNNRWVSHTMPMGSYREVELLIAKSLTDDIKNLAFSYIKKDTAGQSRIQYYPSSIITITGDPQLDIELQNGNLPSINGFLF